MVSLILTKYETIHVIGSMYTHILFEIFITYLYKYTYANLYSSEASYDYINTNLARVAHLGLYMCLFLYGVAINSQLL